MARGVHFALSDTELDELLAARGDEAVMEQIEEIEERWEKDWLCETDSAWQAIHLALTSGRAPRGLGRATLGGRQLYKGDDYVVALVQARDVPKVATGLAQLDEGSFRKLYDGIDVEQYGRPLSGEDFSYTWGWFLTLRAFWKRAAEAGRAVVFTVDG